MKIETYRKADSLDLPRLDLIEEIKLTVEKAQKKKEIKRTNMPDEQDRLFNHCLKTIKKQANKGLTRIRYYHGGNGIFRWMIWRFKWNDINAVTLSKQLVELGFRVQTNFNFGTTTLDICW